MVQKKYYFKYRIYRCFRHCTEPADLCKLPGGRGGKFKLPTLTELHQFLFESSFEEAHNASADVEATARCFRADKNQKLQKRTATVD